MSPPKNCRVCTDTITHHGLHGRYERQESHSKLLEWSAREQAGRLPRIGSVIQDKIKRGRIGGRTAFSKPFRNALIAHYDSRDAITGERMDSRHLQIDHRVPYEVAGEELHDESDLNKFMLLDASSQRAKSWSCEQCHNWQEGLDVAVCRSCFWAFPGSYTHIAGEQVRRVEVEWRGSEVAAFEKLRTRAKKDDMTVAAFIKELVKRLE